MQTGLPLKSLWCVAHSYFYCLLNFFSAEDVWSVMGDILKEKHPARLATWHPSGEHQHQSANIWSNSVISNALWSTAPFSRFHLHYRQEIEREREMLSTDSSQVFFLKHHFPKNQVLKISQPFFQTNVAFIDLKIPQYVCKHRTVNIIHDAMSMMRSLW